MSKKMTVWGIGLRFTLFSSLYFVLVLVIHYVWYPTFVIRGVPYAVLAVAGVILIAIGVPIWIAAARSVDRAFEEGILMTQGVYALCRHPIYGNAIFFTIPGVLLFFRSWLLLSVPLVMYALLKVLIREEENYLRQTFGEAYLAYEKEVNAVFPQVWEVYSNLWYPEDTGQITDNVYAVKVRDVNLFLYAVGQHILAFDAASAGDDLQEELKRLPIAPKSVTHLFLTHTDADHAGGLALFPGARLYLSSDEEQMIDGETARFLRVVHNARIDRPYTLLTGGDVVDAGGIKIQAIATPGHTPGSMSYLVDDRFLFTGDTLVLRNEQVHPFYRLFNMDTATQKQSIRKLAGLRNVALLCTAHTGCTTDYERAMMHWRPQGAGAKHV
jgi:hydroxyacylglutathione hydrolase